MKVSKYPFLVLFLLFFFDVRSQTIHGTVRDADNGAVLTGASVELFQGKSTSSGKSVVTGINGEFSFEGVRPGYYRCSVAMTEYESLSLSEISASAGKEQTLDISLVRQTSTLPFVTISGTRPGRRPLQPLSEIPLTRDQTFRFPSMSYDPARLAAAYPGVAQTDDGINGMSIRGNSPSFINWRLNGAEVVNPNHLPNAGTFSDQPAAASGGILMLSAQLLDNSSLLTGVFPPGMGNALGGIMDMNLRQGNTREREFTIQASLVGLDVAAEGPLNKSKNSSYLVNYRYSTVGFLEKLGVSFGDEQINFQDLSFNLSLNGKKGGQWSIFGVGGISENLFTHKSDLTAVQQYKDLFDITYHSRTGVVGFSNWKPLSSKTWIKTTVALSGQGNERLSSQASDPVNQSVDTLNTTKLSVSFLVSHKINEFNRITGGIMANSETDFLNSFQSLLSSYHNFGDRKFAYFQPWVRYGWTNSANSLGFTVGLHSLLYPDGHQYSMEPRLSVTRTFSARHRLSASWGMYSQIPPPWLGYPTDVLLKAWHAGLRYTWTPVSFWTVKGEIFWQRQSNLGVSYDAQAFSLMNASEISLFPREIRANGKGDSKGLELSAERFLNNDWFLAANTTLFKSQYAGYDQVWRDSRWDLGHLANFTIGKEWYKEKGENKVRSFGLNGRLVWTGGYREMPINIETSSIQKTTVFNENNGYSIKLPDYFRADIRVYWKRNLGNRHNSVFAIDIQNVTGQKNVAYHYYDPFTGKVETKYQLAYIPNISWRLEF
jgi:hypothetical protein